jgi:membrane-associated protease RseP (regulator of RpoE activity)
VQGVLQTWDGTHFSRPTPAGTELTLVRRIVEPRPERWWLHALLFLLTAFTATAAGARFAGFEPLPMMILPIGTFNVPVVHDVDFAALRHGLIFSVPLIGILFAHELGHYIAARLHRMNVSPPYFIPAPRFNVIGTFGAFIRLRSPIVNRAMLLDVGSAGPVASFVLSLPVLAVGLARSAGATYPLGEPPHHLIVMFGNQMIFLGDSIAFRFIAVLFAPEGDVLLLHPLAFAGWLGLFVTAVNLFPLSQLDGGHVLYSLLREWQPRLGIAFLALLLALGWLWWGWWLWAALILLLGRGTIRHPAVLDPDFPVRGRRRTVGWFCVAIFVLCFVAIPFRI